MDRVQLMQINASEKLKSIVEFTMGVTRSDPGNRQGNIIVTFIMVSNYSGWKLKLLLFFVVLLSVCLFVPKSTGPI